MQKDLSAMTRAQLGRLFPIRICPYDPAWPQLFCAESQKLARAAGRENVAGIEHIGSTAVPGLSAKPVVDILMMVKKNTDLRALRQNLEKAGYAFSAQPDRPAPHMMFMKGYGPAGYTGQAYHLHIRYPGRQDETVFRDRLRAHPKEAAAYARLKAALAAKYRFDRDGYTRAKTAFIRGLLAQEE
jgi:GrpB-like predicted nucleotidyltransferase (UPF0157 family)